jgi:thioredoxin-like negative regulator of GroEL
MEHLSPRDFADGRLRHDGLWAVCFAAEWCPFCQEFVPKFAALDPMGEFRTGLADVTDLESPLWDEFRIDVIPTLVAFRDGRPIWRRDGLAGEGLDTGDLDALCHEVAGRPCSPEALNAQARFFSRRPSARDRAAARARV